uniref:Receptor activity-modifying protein 1 n=1 Tax=Gallus gallus TaxID=9031 RepID=A0A8V0YGF2_CHICK
MRRSTAGRSVSAASGPSSSAWRASGSGCGATGMRPWVSGCPAGLPFASRSRMLIFPGVSEESTYGELTNCTVAVAENLTCYWPNRLVDEFFVAVHSHYFRNCSPSGRALRDPPNSILCPFILVPILVTLLMTALVVWRSKRSEGIV